MSSFSTSLKLLLASGVLAGLTLAACGSDTPSSNSSDDESATGSTTTKKDAGTAKKDAGTAKKDAGSASSTSSQPMIPGIKNDAVEGDDCGSYVGGHCADDACDEPPCGTACMDGVFGPCAPASSFAPPGTTTGKTPADAGSSTSTKSDGGSSTSTGKDAGTSTSTGKDAGSSTSTTSGDAGAASSCPAPNVCSDPDKPGVISSMLLMLSNQARYCTTGDGTGGSVVCANGVADCVAGGLTNATCKSQFCIQLCK